jgi:hypothetical protein
MATDGKQVEELVAFVEKTLLPDGFEVKTNRKLYSDGGQIAEFDVEIRGKVGSGQMSWLIECRDRPSEGPAPGAWIEQLVGRRARFGFNKVTAVSTSGFAAGAIEFAKSQGVELREVKSLSPEEFSGWLGLREISQIKHLVSLERGIFIIDPAESELRKQAATDAMKAQSGGAFLKRSATGECLKPERAFQNAVDQAGALFDGLVPDGPGKRIRLNVTYRNDADHFVVETASGDVRVRNIVFEGVLCIKVINASLISTAEYREVGTGKAISQVAAFGDQEINGITYSLEMHRIVETGELNLILRKKGESA